MNENRQWCKKICGKKMKMHKNNNYQWMKRMGLN